MAACRQLGFDVTGNSAIRSADPENPTLESNTKCIGSPVARVARCPVFDRTVRFLAICPVKNMMLNRTISCPVLADLENCTKFGQLILSKIIKIVVTSCQISRLKCTKFDFSWGSAYSAPQTP